VEASDEKWQADFDLKLFSAIRLSRAAFPGMWLASGAESSTR